ncbi:hypothetical protein Pmani_031565 [Petrolisthes manimaculis]|uniref:Uncharacterized protein n=1 Tax=Petrolisthes manimaculis TaxID=1843537 RepID=A0AAE1TUQ6_9EUCA|nr:hypothetical protein Pmani_031565 [Petrolisthes manimaculis]
MDHPTTISEFEWTTDWDENRTGIREEELPRWVVELDNAATLIITANTVILMLGMGAATYWKEFWEHLKRPWACILGLACQFLLLPAAGFGLSLAFRLPPYQALGVLILACSPGGAFSNFFTYWVDGDLALSIMMTALSAILAFGAMPLNLWLYTTRWTSSESLVVPYINILFSLIFLTIPIIVGMAIRHFTRRWANYISKSHKISRTVAIETSCQNMVVATSIMLLSFTSPKVRGNMVIFPVLYGLCQLAEIAVATATFQAWVFIHRHDVTEEDVTSVLDTTLLTSVPVPAHKLSQARVEEMTRHTQKGDNQTPPLPYTMRYEESHYHPPESHMLMPLTSDTVDHQESLAWNTSHTEMMQPSLSPLPDTPIHKHHLNQDQHCPTSIDSNFNLDLDQIVESVCSYDSDVPGSPTLSNKGVPNMFPVSDTDYSGQKDSFSIPFQNLIPSYHRWSGLKGDEWRSSDSLPFVSPTNPPYQSRSIPHIDLSPTQQQSTNPTQQTTGMAHQNTISSPQSISPSHHTTSPTLKPPSFNFYHQDIRLGQTRQFGTLGRKHE